MKFEAETWLPRPRPWLHFHILDPAIVIGRGVLIDYKLRIHGVPLRWQSEISRWEPPFSFVDEQRKGPYRRWVHAHTFAEERGGTLVGDSVEFDAPFEWLTGGFVMRDVRKIFAFRQQALQRRFGSG